VQLNKCAKRTVRFWHLADQRELPQRNRINGPILQMEGESTESKRTGHPSNGLENLATEPRSGTYWPPALVIPSPKCLSFQFKNVAFRHLKTTLGRQLVHLIP
jgi:hypothetical protein